MRTCEINITCFRVFTVCVCIRIYTRNGRGLETFQNNRLCILNNVFVFRYIPNVCVNADKLTLKEARASHTLFSMNSSVILRDGCSLNTEFIKAILAALRLASAFVGQNWDKKQLWWNNSPKQRNAFTLPSPSFTQNLVLHPIYKTKWKLDGVPGSFRSSCLRGDWRSRRMEDCWKEPSHTPPTLRSSARLLETVSSARTPAEPPPRSLSTHQEKTTRDINKITIIIITVLIELL